MIKRLFEDLKDLGWTVAGTGLVLITLSGETLKWGLWISGAALAVNVGVIMFKKEND